MKKIATGLFLLVFFHSGHAQITIDDTDMPLAGDTIRLSITNIVTVDYTKTGTDTTWDFSSLQPLNQRVDTFVNVLDVPVYYYPFFVLTGAANLASPRGGSNLFPGVAVSNAYEFYKNTTSSFTDAGTAFMVQGIPLPLAYDTPDKLYSFPLTTGTQWSSASQTGVQIPSLVYYHTMKQRDNGSDGWGTLITPFGTFATIRVRSDIVEHDSVYIDSMGTGFLIDRIITEYKWLGKGQALPLLTITEEGPAVTVTYRDIPRMPATPLAVNIGPDTTVTKGDTVTLTAHATGGAPPYRYFWSTLDTAQSISVVIDTTKTLAIVVFDAVNNFVTDQRLFTAVNAGIEERKALSLELFPNPASGELFIRIPGTGTYELEILDQQGKPTRSGELISGSPGELKKIDIYSLPNGSYIIVLAGRDVLFSGQVLVLHPR